MAVFPVVREHTSPHRDLTLDHPPRPSPGRDPDSFPRTILCWDIHPGSPFQLCCPIFLSDKDSFFF